MSKQIHEKLARGEARIVNAPAVAAANDAAPRHQVDVDRNFELPTGLYAATVGLYMAFLAITWTAFANPGLAIPMVIFAVFVVAGFGVPAIWTRLRDNPGKPLPFHRFKAQGIQTLTGKCSARDAMVQMLILPVLIVFWGLAVAVIAALV